MVEFATTGCQLLTGTASAARRVMRVPTGGVPDWFDEELEATVSLAPSKAACSLQNSSEMALRFVGSARFIKNLYETAPTTARKRNFAKAAAFEPLSIVTASSPNRRTSITYGCLNNVGVAVGMLVGTPVSPGANGARV
jgi:hypothetical protein